MDNEIKLEKSMMVIQSYEKRTLKLVMKKRESLSGKDLEKFTFKLNLNG